MKDREGKLRRAGQDGYRLLHTSMLLGIVLAGAGSFLGIEALSLVHVLTAAAALLSGVLLQRLTAKGRAVCALLTVVFLGVLAVALGVERAGLFLRSWSYWLSGQGGWEVEWRVGYELLQVVMIVFACYGLQSILQRFLVVKVLAADLLISLLLFCLLTEWEVSHAAVVFSLCYILVVYAEWVQREWNKVKGTDRQRYMLWIMPFMGLYFVLLLCVPTPKEPYEWQFVKDACSRIGESLTGLTENFMRGGGDDFDTTLSGFSGEGMLQDELQENDREMMTVQGTGNLVTNVYLTGRIYDTFDGKGWQQRYHGTIEDVTQGFWDAVQMQEAAVNYDAGSLRDQISVATLQIRYQHFRTSSLFVPLKTKEIRMPREQDFYTWDGDNLLFRERKGYGTAYEVNYYQINAGADSFDRFLREAVPDSGGADAAQDRGTIGLADTEAIDQERISEDRYGTGEGEAAAMRRQQIHQIYTEEVILSEEVWQYLEDVTAGAQDPLERLRRIEGELASFTYTKNPRKLPEDIKDAETFLEYFLLEGREGYCTHFATAFVLLARAQGMPARYVQGFCVPMIGREEMSVYSDMAHAWPEVYFDGVGWIPFEPTPGYARFRYTPWATEEGEGSAVVSYGEAAQETEDAGAASGSEESLAVSLETGETGAGAWRFLTVLGYAMLAVCVTGIGILALQRAMRRRRYRRMDVTGKFRMEIAANLRTLGLIGLRREEGETLQEFRERIVGDRAQQGSLDCALQCITDYEEILYGERTAEPKMLKTAVKERKELLAVLRERKKWRYVFFRWRLMV